MAKKYLLFSLEEDDSKKLGEIISNPTAKKIANLLAEKEASEKDISDELKIPLNTIEYNLKKLLNAGIIEKSKKFFWSPKGRKIEMYKAANKLIVISPKKSSIYNKLKTIIPVVFVSVIFTILILSQAPLQIQQSEEDTILKISQEQMLTAQEAQEITNQSPLLSNLEISLIIIWILIVAFVIYAFLKKDK